MLRAPAPPKVRGGGGEAAGGDVAGVVVAVVVVVVVVVLLPAAAAAAAAMIEATVAPGGIAHVAFAFTALTATALVAGGGADPVAEGCGQLIVFDVSAGHPAAVPAAAAAAVGAPAAAAAPAPAPLLSAVGCG